MEQEDPKFVAVKVDVSAVSERYDFKVVVISDVTSTRGVVANVLRKIRRKGESAHAYDLVARMEGNGHNGTALSHVIFHEDDHPLVEYSNHPKGAIRFILQKKGYNGSNQLDDAIDGQGGSDTSTSRQVAIDKLRRSLESLRKTTTSNVATSNGRVDPTSDVALKERLARHREASGKRRASGTEADYQCNVHEANHDTSSNYTFTGAAPHEENTRPLPAVGTWRRDTKAEFSVFEDSGIDIPPAGKDDTQTTTTANSSRPVSSPTSSGRENAQQDYVPEVQGHPEQSNLERSRSLYSHSVPTIQDFVLQERTSLGDPTINRSCVSLSEYKPKRSLPSLSISLEDLNEKKRSISQILAEKVKDYIAEKESERNGPGALTPYMAAVDSRKSRDYDDSMSLASLEVANIMDDASDISNGDDVDPEGYESSVSSTSNSSTDQYSDDPAESNDVDSTSDAPHTTDDTDIPQVELPPNPADSDYYPQRERKDSASGKHGAWNVVKTSPSETYGTPVIQNGYRHCNGGPLTHSPQTRGHIRMGTNGNYSSPSYMVQGRGDNGYFQFTEEPLTLHGVLLTHDVVPISLVKSSAPSYGIIVYRADFPGTPPYMQHQQTQHLATWRVTAVLEAVPDTPAFTCGNILPGDVIVEVNGHNVLSTPVEDVRALLDSKHKLQVVIARWRHKQAPVRKVWDC